MSVINDLLPLPSEIEDKLIIQVLSSLCHTRIELDDNRFDKKSSDLREEKDETTNVFFPNVNTYMKSNQAALLFKIFMDLAHTPVDVLDNKLGKFKFKKNVSYYDYEEEVRYDNDKSYDDYAAKSRFSSSTNRRSKYDDYFQEDYDDNSGRRPRNARRSSWDN